MSRAECMRFARGFFAGRVRSRVVVQLGVRLCVIEADGVRAAQGSDWPHVYLNMRAKREAHETAPREAKP